MGVHDSNFFNKFEQDIRAVDQTKIDSVEIDKAKSKNGYVTMTVKLRTTQGGTRDVHVTIDALKDTSAWIKEMIPVLIKSFADSQDIEKLHVSQEDVTIKTKGSQEHKFERKDLDAQISSVNKDIGESVKKGKRGETQVLTEKFSALQTVNKLFEDAKPSAPSAALTQSAVKPTAEPPKPQRSASAPILPQQSSRRNLLSRSSSTPSVRSASAPPRLERSQSTLKLLGKLIDPSDQRAASKRAASEFNKNPDELSSLKKLNSSEREQLFSKMVRKDLTDAAFKELVRLYPDEMRKLPGAELEVNLVEIKDFLDRGVALNVHDGKMVESSELKGTDTIKEKAQAHINKVIEEALDKKDPKLLALVEAILDDPRVEVDTNSQIIAKYNTLQRAPQKVSVDSYSVPKEFESYRSYFLMARACDTLEHKGAFEQACNKGYEAAMANGDSEGMEAFVKLQDRSVFGVAEWTLENEEIIKLPPVQIDIAVNKARGTLSDDQVVRASNLVQNEVVRLSGNALFKVKNEARPAADDHEIHEILPGDNYFVDTIENNLFFRQDGKVYVVALIPLT